MAGELGHCIFVKCGSDPNSGAAGESQGGYRQNGGLCPRCASRSEHCSELGEVENGRGVVTVDGYSLKHLLEALAIDAESRIVWAGVDAAWTSVDCNAHVAGRRALLNDRQFLSIDLLVYFPRLLGFFIEFGFSKAVHVDTAIGAILCA